MVLSKKEMVLISFMLFSLFFGAGNLIFPTYLGQLAANHTLFAMLGFLVTAVVLPVLGVYVVVKFDGLNRLASKVNGSFAFLFTLLIYLSIGPGLGIPRAASLPFEMAVAPYLPSTISSKLGMLIYSFIFFLIAFWLCMNPGKLVDRIGHFLTPTLLFLLTFLFISFLFKGQVNISSSQPRYQSVPLLQGFIDGYQTMDTIAALNFGLVIATTLSSFGLKQKKVIQKHTLVAGIFAGMILSLVYLMLSYMGMCSSGTYTIQENGAWTLRCIVGEVYGEFGAILLASIFTLACLTTSVGLINSISNYFSIQFNQLNYKQWVGVIVFFSFFICNLGLNTILSISVPILSAIYPISIVLILLGLSDPLIKDNPYIYPIVIAFTACVSILLAIDSSLFSIPFLHYLPFYSYGFGWVSMTILGLFISLVINKVKNNK